MTSTNESVTLVGVTLRLIDVLGVILLLRVSSELLRVTIELINVTDKLLLAVELTCVTSELNDDFTKLGVTTTVRLSDVTKRVIVVALLCVTVVLFIRGDEKLTEVILDPTEEKLGAVEEFIFTIKVLLSVTLAVVRDVTDVEPWDKKHVVLQHKKCHGRSVLS